MKLKFLVFPRAALALVASAMVSQATAQDYKAYGKLLSRYATESGVKYKSWANNSADKAALQGILDDWAKVDTTKLSGNDRAAFRINLYNAAMIDVVLDRYPLKSVTRIGVPFSIFKKELVRTPQGAISLDTLEKKQLLGDFPDARVHFAVNCASVSCPPLAGEPYTGWKLDRQLTSATRAFANSAEAVVVKGKTARYSELFKWYKKDFGTSDPAQYLNKYRREKLPSGLKVKWQKYNWGLNEAG